jgi:hypothetical protein
MDALVKLEIGQPIARGISLHHLVMDATDITDLIVRRLNAGEPAGKVFQAGQDLSSNLPELHRAPRDPCLSS